MTFIFEHVLITVDFFYWNSGQMALRSTGEVKTTIYYRLWESYLVHFQVCLVNQVPSHCTQWINNSTDLLNISCPDSSSCIWIPTLLMMTWLGSAAMPCGTYGNCGYSSGTVTRQDVHVNWLLPNTHFSFFCSVEESVSLYLSSSDNIHCFDEVSTPITRIDWQYSDGLVNLLALLQRSTESHNRYIIDFVVVE